MKFLIIVPIQGISEEHAVSLFNQQVQEGGEGLAYSVVRMDNTYAVPTKDEQQATDNLFQVGEHA
jgi:hypothetical protein